MAEAVDRPAGLDAPDDGLQVVDAAGCQPFALGSNPTELTPSRWPPPVILTWTLPEATSMSTGAGALPATASRLPSRLNAIAEIWPTPGAGSCRACRGS
jgi:hypothetical protein